MYSFVHSCYLLTCLGQAVLAHVTSKIIKSEPVSDTFIKRAAFMAFLVALSFYIWTQLRMPGMVILGTFCMVPPVFAKPQGGFHAPGGPRILDPRTVYNSLSVQTLVISIVKYIRCWLYLCREKKKLKKMIKGGEKAAAYKTQTPEREGKREKGGERQGRDCVYVKDCQLRQSPHDLEPGQLAPPSMSPFPSPVLPHSPLPSQHHQVDDGTSPSPSAVGTRPDPLSSPSFLESHREPEEEGGIEGEQALMVEMEERVRAAQHAVVLMLLPSHKAESGVGSPRIREEPGREGEGEREGRDLEVEEQTGEVSSIPASRGGVLIERGAEGEEDLIAEYARREMRLEEMEEGRQRMRRRVLGFGGLLAE